MPWKSGHIELYLRVQARYKQFHTIPDWVSFLLKNSGLAKTWVQPWHEEHQKSDNTRDIGYICQKFANSVFEYPHLGALRHPSTSCHSFPQPNDVFM